MVVLAMLASAPVTAAPARSSPPGRDAKARAARSQFEKAERSFNLGKFPEALTSYEAAYETLPLPAFLFNIAQCYRNLGNHERAVFFYQRYLSLDPKASNRAVVHKLIVDQQHRLEEARASAATTPPPEAPRLMPAPARQPSPLVATRPAKQEERTYPKWWFWGALGTAVALGTAAFFIAGSGGGLPKGDLGAIDGR